MHLLLLRHAFIELNEMPRDVTHHFIKNFYLPLRVAAYEKQLIEESCRELEKSYYSYQLASLFNTHCIVALVNNPLFILDTRIRDDRIDRLIAMIWLGIRRGVCHAHQVTEILFKALEIDIIQAFNILYDAGLISLYPKKTASFVSRISRKISRMPEWDSQLCIDTQQLVRYLLDKKLEEPLLEWLIVWPIKGIRLFQRNSFNGRQKTQYEMLYIKSRSPELAPIRRRVLQGHGYIC